jgi:hypothetical protein
LIGKGDINLKRQTTVGLILLLLGILLMIWGLGEMSRQPLGLPIFMIGFNVIFAGLVSLMMSRAFEKARQLKESQIPTVICNYCGTPFEDDICHECGAARPEM